MTRRKKKTTELIDLIEKALADHQDKADEIKQNLMSEAYYRNGGLLGRTTAC